MGFTYCQLFWVDCKIFHALGLEKGYLLRTTGVIAILVTSFFLISKIAAAQSITRVFRHEKVGFYKAETKYPQFEGTTPLSQFVNLRIETWAKQDQARYVSGVTKEIRARLAEDKIQKLDNPWEYSVGCRTTILRRNNVISVLCSGEEYHGGAHPSNWYKVFNFERVASSSRELVLSNLFRVSGFLPAIAETITQKLHQEEAANGRVVGFERLRIAPNDSNHFVLESDGLLFVFSRCEIASCSSGQLQVKLGVSDLGPNFKKELIN